MDDPQVGIVITAYNNADTIVESITSLRSQSYEKKHIFVIVDQSSSDETERIVDDLCGRLDRCSVIKCKGVGRSKARNIGWMSVSCPVVMFADGDDVYDEAYLAKAIAGLFSGPEVGGVCVGGAPLPTGKRLLDDFYRAYGATDDRSQAGKQPDWAWVYKIECLKNTCGFDESLSQAEDKDFCSRVKEAGFRIAYVPGVNWHRRKAQSFREFISKEYFAGRRRVFYYAKKRSYGQISKGLSPAFLSFSLIVLGVVEGLTVAAAAAMFVLLIFAAAITRKARRNSGSPGFIGGYSLMAVSARLAFSAGTLHGLAVLLARYSGITRIDAGRF